MNTQMNYSAGTGDLENWLVSETGFSADTLGKCETVMSLGNGYMGIRSATEEHYPAEVRNTFVAGTFDAFDGEEVTELPNVADMGRLDIALDGENFDLTSGETESYSRTLNLRTGELVRSVRWRSPGGKAYELTFRRFVSQKKRHLFLIKIEIKNLNDAPAESIVNTGINGQLANTGSQHFSEGEKRRHDKKYFEYTARTRQSGIEFAHHFVLKTNGEENGVDHNAHFDRIDRRLVNIRSVAGIPANGSVVYEKIGSVHTTRDIEHEGKAFAQIRSEARDELKEASRAGYASLLRESAGEWERFWSRNDVEIDSDRPYDQLAVRFALYHLVVFTPRHDARMSIAAKGLSGEGYKGHAFWDTEIFCLPPWTFIEPETARKLVEYRYRTLKGAFDKAEKNGYRGAMFPWESAWMDDGEVTPLNGAADLETGESIPILSGLIEHHITADVAWGVWQYEKVTGDAGFMEKFGYELLFETGVYWASRLEWNEEKQRGEINNVIGPDEYKEKVDNNAFTNYMAHWNIKLALEYIGVLKDKCPAVWIKMDKKYGMDKQKALFEQALKQIYLPQLTEEGLLPQDDTYLSKPEIDLTKYKNQENVGTIHKEYSHHEVQGLQVSKQADVMVLFILMEQLFSAGIKRKNFEYYEAHTLHDSSLSLSSHTLLACDIGDKDLAYRMFSKASEIDLGPNMKTSDHGIHAASVGGIWQGAVMGFGGLRMIDGRLRVNPRLPDGWSRLAYRFSWRGERIAVAVTPGRLILEKEGGAEIPVETRGEIRTLKERLEIAL